MALKTMIDLVCIEAIQITATNILITKTIIVLGIMIKDQTAEVLLEIVIVINKDRVILGKITLTKEDFNKAGTKTDKMDLGITTRVRTNGKGIKRGAFNREDIDRLS